MTDDVVWRKEAWKNRSNINRIRELVMTDENATNVEKMKVVTLTEIHDQLWWLALVAKIFLGVLIFNALIFLLIFI